MKALLLVALVAAMLVGCNNPPPPGTTPAKTGPRASAQSGGLSIDVEVTQEQYALGETMPVTITVRNSTQQCISCQSPTAATLYVAIMKQVPQGWTEFKRIPDSAAALATPWTVGPGQETHKTITVPLTTDFPTNEPLRVVGPVNGMTGAEAYVTVEIKPTIVQVQRPTTPQ